MLKRFKEIFTRQKDESAQFLKNVEKGVFSLPEEAFEENFTPRQTKSILQTDAYWNTIMILMKKENPDMLESAIKERISDTRKSLYT